MANCINANDIGFLVNVAGIATLALSLGDPGAGVRGARGMLVYIKRPRLLAAGLGILALSVIFLVMGAHNPDVCLTPGEVASGAFLIEKKRAFCQMMRPILAPPGNSSAYAAIWAQNLALIAIAVVAALLARVGVYLINRPGAGIAIGIICFMPLLGVPWFFVSKLLWTSSYHAAISAKTAGEDFSFERFGGDKDSLNAALKLLLPAGTPKIYVDQILASKAAPLQATKGPTISYLHWSASLAGCLYSEEMPPRAWRVDVSYSPDQKLKALFAMPVLDTTQ